VKAPRSASAQIGNSQQPFGNSPRCTSSKPKHNPHKPKSKRTEWRCACWTSRAFGICPASKTANQISMQNEKRETEPQKSMI
jgi:hypothetical protein